ncbi:phospholipase-like, aminotransferase-like mobile domain protein [Tanacetum coccineum]
MDNINWEYPAKIHVRSKLHCFPLIKDRLNEARRSLFRTTCFGPWLDISYVENDDCMIHYVLQKQSFSDDESFDLPLIYHLNGHSLHFGRRQFCLVTGFKFGLISLREHSNGDIHFRNRLFPKKIGYGVIIIDVLAFIEDEEKFSKVSDEDAIRLCLLLYLEVIFMGRELVSVVDDAFLRMVNYLDAWNAFHWGEHIWRQLYDSIRNVCSKHKLEHLDGLRKNPNHIWIIESSCESHRWWTRVPEIIPRAVSWTRTTKCLKWEYFAELFDKTPIELSPTKAERQCSWNSHKSDEIRFEVFCCLEEGLTLVENDKDIEKMFEVARYHGTIDLYICHTPRVYLVDYYLKNVTVDDSDEEVTSIYRSHENAKKNVDTISFEELVAWEKEEAESPSVLRSPHVLLDDFEDVGKDKGKGDGYPNVGDSSSIH